MFSSANNLKFAFIILLIAKGGNALSVNAGKRIVGDQRDLPTEILLEMEMDTVLN